LKSLYTVTDDEIAPAEAIAKLSAPQPLSPQNSCAWLIRPSETELINFFLISSCPAICFQSIIQRYNFIREIILFLENHFRFFQNKWYFRRSKSIRNEKNYN